MSSRYTLDPIDSDSHSFVIKIWPGNAPEEAGQGNWQGRITHVPSGQNSPLDELSQISEFIMPYLESMGVKPTIRTRVSRWAHQLRG